MKIPWKYRFRFVHSKGFMQLNLGIVLFGVKFGYQDFAWLQDISGARQYGIFMAWIPLDVVPGSTVPLIFDLKKTVGGKQVEA